MYRTLLFYKHYFKDFYLKQGADLRDKIDWTFDVIKLLSWVPKVYLKHIEGTQDIYEIRVQQQRHSVRICCFFDDDNIIVIGNAFLKKKRLKRLCQR